ncbi:MAG: peptide ABC transporter substrate-binding protein [Ardenticatenaceae bacterium]|nr:peptide ABC transporter substrate-binding protein [Ardenticatenaceae bacterium]
MQKVYHIILDLRVQKKAKALYQRLLMSLVVSLGLVSVACSEPDDTPVVVTEVVVIEGEEVVVTRLVRQTIAITATPEPNAAPREPITLDLAYVGNFPNADPQTAASKASLDLIENAFVGLTRYNHQTNQVEPELAASWSVDGRTWTFNLRDDIYWVRPTERNGAYYDAVAIRPVTAQDVVYALQRICQRETQTPDAFTLFIIEGCERAYNLDILGANDIASIGAHAVDDYTLQFTLTKPASYFLTMTSMWMFTPIPAQEIEVWQAETPEKDWLAPEQLMSSGPFMPLPGTWNSNRVVLHPNPFWPLPRAGNVEIINLNYVESDENAFKLWEAKGLDISPLPAARVEAFMAASSGKVRLLPEQTVFYLGFNFDSGVFREPDVRRAFSTAIDREALVEDVYGGQVVAMRHLSPPGVFGAPPVDQAGIGYSPDYARLQMEASGFRSCRLMPPIRFMISTSDLSLLQAELIRGMWVDELDCEESQIEIVQVEFGTLLANTRADAGIARPDVWELGWASYYPDAHNWLSDLLHCSDSENRQNRPCSEPDDLLRQATAVTDPEQRITLYRQIENQFFGEGGLFPIVPLYARGNYVLVQNWLEYTPALFGGEQFDTYQIDADLKRLERSR